MYSPALVRPDIRVLDRDDKRWTIECRAEYLRDIADMPRISASLRHAILGGCRGIRDAASAILVVSPGDAFRIKDAIKEVV